ncbi:uncharacterized protein LOC141656408 [Silene latifolia]|uniref:uncharacterized protein LOC141656408 n=1 Tax=Silene latifolia TaxID=37657 RepID=UPI003D77BFAE
MESDKTVTDDHEEEEYVLLDLDAVCCKVDIPPDEPYVLSGLDTLNPILTIGDKLKLIGDYEETIGTCLMFSEKETAKSVKQVKPVASLQKILKFRFLSEADGKDSTENPPDVPEHIRAASTDNPSDLPEHIGAASTENPPDLPEHMAAANDD